MARFLTWVPLITVIIVFWANRSGVSSYRPPHSDSLSSFLSVLTIVVGYFATAGAEGPDLGMNNRNTKDVALGGIFGIVLAVVIAGGLPILSVAG